MRRRLPEDLDEWTIDDLRGLVAAPAAALPAPLQDGKQKVTIADFQDYLDRVGNPYRYLTANRPRPADATDGEQANGGGSSSSEPQALSGVPEICSSPDFDLSDPETFAFFSPPDQPHATMVMVERLTQWLDQVELTLLKEVSLRKDGFFDALNSYNRLTQQVAAGRAQIEALRLRLRSLEVNLVEKSLRLPRLVRQRANTAALHGKLRLVHAVWRTQPTIQQLLTAGDFPGALELITSSQQLLDTELRGVASLSHLGRSLAETKALIQDNMNKEMMQVALGYEIEAGAPATPVEALASELDLRLGPLALGLLRLRVLDDALQALQDQLKTDVRNLIKRRVKELLALHGEAAAAVAKEAAAAPAEPAAPAPAAAAEEGGEAAAEGGGAAAEAAPAPAPAPVVVAPPKKNADQLRELSLDAFEEVMAGVVASVMVLLRRAAAIHAAIVKALGAAASASAVGAGASADGAADGVDDDDDAAGAYAQQIERQSAELLQSVCELSHDRYARLLKVRKEVHCRLPLTLFVRVNRVAVEFARDVQHLCGAPCHSLTGELQQHAAAFLDATHAENSRKLEAIVEVEQWKQVDIAADYQDIVSSLVRKQVPRIQEAQLLKLREDDASTAGAPAAADKATAKELLIDGAGYKAVGSGLLLLSMVTHYLQCLANLQTVATHVAQKLPALLKLFHTKAYQQVLMAGAMRPDSAALKSITSKHLALSSQSLGMFLALLPHIKAVLAAYVPENQRALLKEMDSAAADYEEHQQQLFAKFVSILEERRRTHVVSLKEKLAPSEERRRPETSSCIKAVVQDIDKMHKTLQPLLTKQQLQAVFAQVFSSFDAGLLGSYQALDTTPVFTRQCIVQDVHFARTEVDKLHLVPNVFPELVRFAQSLSLHAT